MADAVVVVVDELELVPGDEVVFTSVLVLLLLELEPPAGDGFTIVVLFSVLLPGEAAGVTVSVLCSHEARSAALAMMQMYFFIS